MNKTHEEFKKIVDDLYEQGYIAGFGSSREKWIDIYARAMIEIANGGEFTDELLFSLDNDLPTNMNALH